MSRTSTRGPGGPAVISVLARTVVLAAAVAACPARAAGPGADGVPMLEAVYDDGQSGDLAPMVLTRNYVTVDPLGAPVGVDVPRWAPAGGVGSFEHWSTVSNDDFDVLTPWAGFDRDGVTPMMAILNSLDSRMHVWLGAAPSEPASLVIDMKRNDGGITITDALEGDPLQLPHVAYRPKACVVLPGAFVFLCSRSHDENEDPANRDWQVEGVSLLVYQHHIDTTWSWSIVADGPRLAGDETALGWQRLHPSAMGAYYPRERGTPLLRAFIPYVDYISDFGHPVARPGGQLFLVEASRSSVFADWSFGPSVQLYERVEDGTHFHSAAWTPNGVIVGIGDSTVRNEVKLFTCSDWDDYANPDRWTQHDRFHGAATYADEPSETPANQFWGCAPGRDLNTVLVGADEVGGALFEITVPENPADGAAFRRLFGQETGSSGTSPIGSNIGAHIHRPAPEQSDRVLVRTFQIGSGLGAAHTRVWLSEDAEHFATIARLPTIAHRSSAPVLYGHTIVLPSRGTTPANRGIWTMPVPTLRDTQRGLRLGPGGRNHLYVTPGTGELAGLASATGVTRTLVQPPGGEGTHPVTGAPLEAPTLGPVYRLEVAPEAERVVLDAQIAGPDASLPSGPLTLAFWINMIGPEGMKLTAGLTDGSASAQQLFKLVERDQWIRCVLAVDGSQFVDGFVPRFELEIAEDHRCDFLFAVDGLYAGSYPGYPIAPINGGINDGGVYPGEQMVQALPQLGTSFTIDLELRLPQTAPDHTLGTLFRWVPLATIWGDADEYLVLEADNRDERLRARLVNGGVEVNDTSVILFTLARHDQVWIRAAFSPSDIRLYAISGGQTQLGIFSGVMTGTLATPPTEVRFGNADFSAVGPVEVLRVGVAPNDALGGVVNDCNGNGVEDADEIADDPGLDADGSGVLDECEERGDLDGDGEVAFTDLLILLAAWGPCDDPPAPCPPDLDDDGFVGFADLLVVLAGWD
jgi:hypothetical protein